MVCESHTARIIYTKIITRLYITLILNRQRPFRVHIFFIHAVSKVVLLFGMDSHQKIYQMYIFQ